MTPSEVVLAIDLGTTATKVAAVDKDFHVLFCTEAANPMITDGSAASGGATAVHDPNTVLAAAIRATRDCVRECERRDVSVAALSFSAAMHTLLALDDERRPLTPALSWADARSSAISARLRAEGGGELQRRLHTATGTPVHPMSPLLKLAWFAEHEPALHREASVWCGLKDYILHNFTASLVIDTSCASGSGLLDIHACTWNAESLDIAGISQTRLPQLADPLEQRPLAPGIAAQLGLPAGLPVVVGAGDGPLANLGAGAATPGSAALSIGTSAALRVTRHTPGIDIARGHTFSYALADGFWVQGGAISNGGLVANWAADIAGRTDIGALLAEAAELPPEFDGLIALPYLLAERAPHWTPEPRAALLGLRHDHGAAAITRALVDGVALQLAAVHESIQSAGVRLATIHATGGALRAKLWTDVMAAAFDAPLTIIRDQAASSAGSARGAAILGWRTLGAIGHLSQVPELTGDVIHPDPRIRTRLTDMRDLHDLAFDTATRAARIHRQRTTP